MEILILLINKLFIMFSFMIIGVILFHKKIITEAGSECLASLLIHLVLPCVILNGFWVEQSAERVYGLIISILFSVLGLGISLVVAKIFFPKNPIDNFAASFSNPGFFGIPLIAAVLGENSIFYVAPFIACLNILQWTYGVSILKNEPIIVDLKKIIKSPFFISFMIGLLIFLVQPPIPSAIGTIINSSANLNTPLAMIVSGIYLAKANIREMFTKANFYIISFVRLIFTPAVCLLLLSAIPGNFFEIKLSLFLAIACPVGSNVAVYAQLHGKNYIYAVQTVVLSTILSLVTIPMWVFIIQYLW